MAKPSTYDCSVLTFDASLEGVSGHVLGAEADGVVVDHFTLRVDAAHAHTRIHALLADARTRVGAVRVEHALGTAAATEKVELVKKKIIVKYGKHTGFKLS